MGAELSAHNLTIDALRLNADLTFAEIAGVTECSLPAVYRRYKKAIHTLRHILEGEK